MIKHVIINEETSDCEWEHWKGGSPCGLPGVMAIADTENNGFHEGHFCDVHIGPAWKLITGEDEPRILNVKTVFAAKVEDAVATLLEKGLIEYRES